LVDTVKKMFYLAMIVVATSEIHADESLRQKASWEIYDVPAMATKLRESLDELGVVPTEIDRMNERFLERVEQQDSDPLDALVDAIEPDVKIVEKLVQICSTLGVSAAAASIDPNTPGYGEIESLPKVLRNSLRTWLGRELVRQRLYDEALPTFAEVDPVQSIDPTSVLFYRGACYHSLLMKKESLADLRRLLENGDSVPARYSRTAELMVADIKPLKEDSLDEISRIMTDVTRRLDLGRSDEEVKKREQLIIDKLSKLIDKIEQQQQQQQQQQAASGKGGGLGGNGSPMQDSRYADNRGKGDVDRKRLEEDESWGNLPPAERQEALQQIGRDLPTHYREAIEAYFRKLATESS
jgi:hypothetical protein